MRFRLSPLLMAPRFLGPRFLAPLLLAFGLIGAAFAPSANAARTHIRIVGSSTVYPFTTSVAEHFAARSGLRAPVVDATGTGGGMQAFCAGLGEAFPDLTNASRRIKKSEFETCRNNGVRDIVEIQIGFDGVAIANRKGAPFFGLTLSQLFLALGAEVPVEGRLVKNPYRRWSQIAPGLPDIPILVFGPPPTSGTRDSFVELGMDKGARDFPVLAELRKKDEKAFEAVARRLREDGAWVDAGENDNAIVQRLLTNPNAVGVFGHSFLEENLDRLQPVGINGIAPETAAIADGTYPLARSMFIYLKRQHVGTIPGLQQFLKLYTSEGIMGMKGVLARKGLIPLLPPLLAVQQARARDLPPMTAPE